MLLIGLPPLKVALATASTPLPDSTSVGFASGSPSPTDWISAAAASVMALVALVALVFAWQQVREARILRAQAADADIARAQPYVVMVLEPSGADDVLFDIVITNFGQTAATNVVVELDPWPTRVDRYVNGSLRVGLPTPIPILGPGQEYRTLWDNARTYMKSDLPKRHEGVVRYHGLGDSELTSPVVLDWSTYEDRRWVQVRTVHDAAKALMAINDEVRQWSEGGSGGIRVTTRDGDLKDARDEAEYQEQVREYQTNEPDGPEMYSDTVDGPPVRAAGEGPSGGGTGMYGDVRG